MHYMLFSVLLSLVAFANATSLNLFKRRESIEDYVSKSLSKADIAVYARLASRRVSAKQMAEVELENVLRKIKNPAGVPDSVYDSNAGDDKSDEDFTLEEMKEMEFDQASIDQFLAFQNNINYKNLKAAMKLPAAVKIIRKIHFIEWAPGRYYPALAPASVYLNNNFNKISYKGKTIAQWSDAYSSFQEDYWAKH